MTQREVMMGWLSRWGLKIFPVACAMHGAWQLRTPWGFLLVKRTTRAYAGLRPWYVYWSPNGTPWAATFAYGPGLSIRDRRMAPVRRAMFGWRGFPSGSVNDALEEVMRLRDNDSWILGDS